MRIRWFAKGFGIALIFGILTFLQGIAEPTEGLVSQPIRAFVGQSPWSAERVTAFSALMSLPWILKPALGLLVDFFPLFQARRQAALILSALIWATAFPFLAVGKTSDSQLLGWLMLATLAAALADVATDAMVVDWGKLEGKTGPFQAAVWFSSYASGIFTGVAGGSLSTRGGIGPAFATCGAAGFVMLILAIFVVREAPTIATRPEWSVVRRSIGAAVRSRGIWAIAIFIALWNFNPLTNAILQVHITKRLGLSESTFGTSLSIFSISAMLASVAYGLYSDRVSMKLLVYSSIILGVVANLIYSPIASERSVLLATAVGGFCYMTPTLVQFDLAARVCPPESTATVFASLMAVSNLSVMIATWLGGRVDQVVYEAWGRDAALQVLILLGAATTALTAVVVPFFPADVYTQPDQCNETTS